MSYKTYARIVLMVSVANLGAVLRMLREAKGINLDQMPMDKGNLSKLECGKLPAKGSGYSHASLSGLADAIGVPLSQIFALAEELQKGRVTSNTIRLVLKIEALSEDTRKAIEILIDLAAAAKPDVVQQWIAPEIRNQILNPRKGRKKKTKKRKVTGFWPDGLTT